MTKTYVIALDQGTTSSRALLIDRAGAVVDVAQRDFPQIFPKPGWVEHNPADILDSQLTALKELVTRNGLKSCDVEAIGIANQRETTIIWDRKTGQPIYNAIVWQCRRTAEAMEELAAQPGVPVMFAQKAGLLPDAYFSASKIQWILEHVAGSRERASAGELAFGTVDSWLLWNLTDGAVHATDFTNASRTLLFNIHDLTWDEELLDLFNVPRPMLPEVKPSASHYGLMSDSTCLPGVPICGVAGDQQAALFGQCCFKVGQAKNTYGTGCFLLMNTGTTPHRSKHNLITTLTATAPGAPYPEYALEGSVFMGGALMQWMRDGLGLLDNVADSADIAASVPDTGGVAIVPAFTGLGAPHWDGEARGVICGITRGTNASHIIRAALEAIAFQVYELARAMEADAGGQLNLLNVDGGASQNDFLMQFQADLLNCFLKRPQNQETTALGAAYLAGLFQGFWDSVEELESLRSDDDVFVSGIDDEKRKALTDHWDDAIQRCLYRP